MCILKVLGSDQKTKNGLIKDLLQENKKQNTKFKHNNCTYIKIKPQHCCDQYNFAKIRVKKKNYSIFCENLFDEIINFCTAFVRVIFVDNIS